MYQMISADTPIVFAKACELFILELTLRAWLQTEECNRRTLQRCDIARALRLDELLDFLVDFVPCNFHKVYISSSKKNIVAAILQFDFVLLISSQLYFISG